MTLENIETLIKKIDNTLNYQAIYDIHSNVNQMYDDYLPYSFHLITARKTVIHFMANTFYEKWKDLSESEVEQIITSILIAVTMHDVMEDCRMNFNDIYNFICKTFMKNNHARCNADMITNIVYALTDEKGRNRDERHNENYWKVLRETPYAGFIKLCDRYANMMYSKLTFSPMLKKYREECAEIAKNLLIYDDDLKLIYSEIKTL